MPVDKDMPRKQPSARGGKKARTQTAVGVNHCVVLGNNMEITLHAGAHSHKIVNSCWMFDYGSHC